MHADTCSQSQPANVSLAPPVGCTEVLGYAAKCRNVVPVAGGRIKACLPLLDSLHEAAVTCARLPYELWIVPRDKRRPRGCEAPWPLVCHTPQRKHQRLSFTIQNRALSLHVKLSLSDSADSWLDHFWADLVPSSIHQKQAASSFQI